MEPLGRQAWLQRPPPQGSDLKTSFGHQPLRPWTVRNTGSSQSPGPPLEPRDPPCTKESLDLQLRWQLQNTG